MSDRIRIAVAEILDRYGLSRSLVEEVEDHAKRMLRPFADAGIPADEVLRELSVELGDSLVAPKANRGMFNNVPLPPSLSHAHLWRAMDYTTSMIAAINRDMCRGIGLPLCKFIQANNFSGIVSNIITNGLNQFSPYKHNHDQRYPDLKSAQGIGLEMKAANKAGKGGESHNGHGGWHLIACFNLDEKTGNIRFVQIEIAELVGHLEEPEGDWHYCGSKVNDQGSRRTETYYTTSRGTWKLRDGSVYLDMEHVNFGRWRRQGIPLPAHSPIRTST